MDFRILGPLEVADDGGAPLPLGGSRQRALLGVLLLNANQVVSADRLIEDLWGERAPDSGRSALQVRVSSLRKALGAAGAQLVTKPPGYVLEVDPEELDLARFEWLVRDADRASPEVAAGSLREALALWRGPPLGDLAYEPFAQGAVRRLEELRLAALEKRVQADLALGRHADLVGELETLIAEHPFQERFHVQLMLALYRCGRQADALGAYQNARRLLVEELGIEPGPALRELEQAILRQDPSIGLGDRTPSPGARVDGRGSATGTREKPESANNLPNEASSFVGRGRELAELGELLTRTRILTLTGPGGVGKTRLGLQLASDVVGCATDGVWFVDLASVAEPALVAASVANALGVGEQPDQALTDQLVSVLRERAALVILDNCERTIDAAGELADCLVRGCPRIMILATSREPLRITGEQLYRVPSLAVPPREEDDPERLITFDAFRLLVDRAREQEPGFALDGRDAALAARVCRQVDGIPLAIELAATRLRDMSLAEIEARLDERLPSPTDQMRSVPRILEALIDPSSVLLSLSEPVTVDPRELQKVMAAEQAHEPFLVVHGASGQLRVLVLGSDVRTLTVGRRAEMDLSIGWDTEVSGLHAELQGFSGEWTIVDDGLSTNGTFVNGSRVRRRQRLRDGDRVRVGQTVLVYRHIERVPIPRTAPAGDQPTLAELTDTERRVLAALCRPYRHRDQAETPAANTQIAAELHLTDKEVESQLRMLFTKFELAGLPQNEQRIRLAECVMQYGLISPQETD